MPAVDVEADSDQNNTHTMPSTNRIPAETPTPMPILTPVLELPLLSKSSEEDEVANGPVDDVSDVVEACSCNDANTSDLFTKFVKVNVVASNSLLTGKVAKPIVVKMVYVIASQLTSTLIKLVDDERSPVVPTLMRLVCCEASHRRQ